MKQVKALFNGLLCGSVAAVFSVALWYAGGAPFERGANALLFVAATIVFACIGYIVKIQ